jgi:putative DNA primase/helicase
MRDGTTAEIVDLALTPKPELMIYAGDLPATATALRDLLAGSGKFFDRGMPVRPVAPADKGPPSATRLTNHNVVMECHRLCQPMKMDRGQYIPATLPDRVARMYLDMVGEWNLSPLDGVSTAPLVSAEGSVRAADGYDPATALWCHNVPRLSLAMRPSRGDSEAALKLLRETFCTFPFGDAVRRWDSCLGVEVVDITEPPGRTRVLSLSTSLLQFVARACGSRRECS